MKVKISDLKFRSDDYDDEMAVLPKSLYWYEAHREIEGASIEGRGYTAWGAISQVMLSVAGTPYTVSAYTRNGRTSGAPVIFKGWPPATEWRRL